MSLIDRAAEQAGIQLDRDVPVPGQRRTRDWARVVGLVRKLESQEAEEQRLQHQRIETLCAKNAELLETVHRLERENEQLKLKERMRQIELPKKDQQVLLGAPGEEAA